MTATPVDCYVYYRIEPAHASSARRTIGVVLARIEERAGVTGRLMQSEDDPMLWMEVYENVRNPARFEAMLSELLDAHRFAQFLAPSSARKIERFVANAG